MRPEDRVNDLVEFAIAYALADLGITREEAWSHVPACAQHYPSCCECEPTKPVGVSDTQENQ